MGQAVDQRRPSACSGVGLMREFEIPIACGRVPIWMIEKIHGGKMRAVPFKALPEARTSAA